MRTFSTAYLTMSLIAFCSRSNMTAAPAHPLGFSENYDFSIILGESRHPVASGYLGLVRNITDPVDGLTNHHVVGSGKTFIAYVTHEQQHLCEPLFRAMLIRFRATLVEDLSRVQFVGHFFFRPFDGSKMSATDLFRALIVQMVAYLDVLTIGCSETVTTTLTRFFKPEAQPPSLNEVYHECFLALHHHMQDHNVSPCYLIDGLHECPSGEVEKILPKIQDLIAVGARVIITGRESPDISTFVEATKITILEHDTRDDIRAFIDWKLASRRRGPLTRNKELARAVVKALNDRANLMYVRGTVQYCYKHLSVSDRSCRFLWVSLQLKIILQCRTDQDIKTTLQNLPPDLNSLYAKCLANIQSPEGRRILCWIYASTRPFKIKELCEFLAIDAETGKLQRSLILAEDAIFEECANLVYLNVNDEVLLVHHSLHQFLGSTDPRSPKWDINIEQLELGRLCLGYLTGPDFSLAVTLRDPHTPIPFNAALLMQQVMPAMGTVLSWYPGVKRAPHRVAVNLKGIGYVRKYASNLPRALEYARKSWLPLTPRLTRKSNHWQKFLDIALQPSQQFDFHPWTCLDISMQAHYSKLLGWAITHSHVPLFQSLQEADPEPRPEIYDLPLPEYDGVLPLHLAASIQSTMTPQAHLIFRRLWALCDRKAVDARGMTVLHHAVIGGNDMILHSIVDGAVIDLEQRDLQNRTALAIAAIEKRTNSLIVLANAGANVDVEFDVTGIANGMCPIMTAAQNGDELSVQILLDKNADSGRTNSTRRKVLHYVVMNATEHSGEIVEELLRKHGPIDSPDSSGKTALELACYARNVQAATVLVREAYNSRQGTPAFFWKALQSDSKIVTTMIQAGALSGSKHPFMNWAAIRRLKELPRKGLFAALKTMIEAGLDFDVEDEGNRTPLFWAHNSDCKELIKAVEWVQSLDPASLPCNQLATVPPGVVRPARTANVNPHPLPPDFPLDGSILPSSDSPSDTAQVPTHNEIPDGVIQGSAPNESHSTDTASCALANPPSATSADHASPTSDRVTDVTNAAHSSILDREWTTLIDESERNVESTTPGYQHLKLVKFEDLSDQARGRALISARTVGHMTTSELGSLLLYTKVSSVWTEEEWRLVLTSSWLKVTMDKLSQLYPATYGTRGSQETLAAIIARVMINLDFLLSLLPNEGEQHYHFILVDPPKPNMVIDELVRLLYFGEFEGSTGSTLSTRFLRRMSCLEHHPSNQVLSLRYQDLGPGVLLCFQVVSKGHYDLEDLT